MIRCTQSNCFSALICASMTSSLLIELGTMLVSQYTFLKDYSVSLSLNIHDFLAQSLSFVLHCFSTFSIFKVLSSSRSLLSLFAESITFVCAHSLRTFSSSCRFLMLSIKSTMKAIFRSLGLFSCHLLMQTSFKKVRTAESTRSEPFIDSLPTFWRYYCLINVKPICLCIEALRIGISRFILDDDAGILLILSKIPTFSDEDAIFNSDWIFSTAE